MDTVIAVLQVVLIIFAGAAGLLRFLTPYEKFIKIPFQEWGNEFQPWQIKAIGLLEIAASLGIIIPMFFQPLTMLTPLAALGIALVMAGAMATHLRRAEYLNMFGNLVWLGIALFFAYSKLPALIA